jgi:hypothetical protein
LIYEYKSEAYKYNKMENVEGVETDPYDDYLSHLNDDVFLAI